MDIWQRDFQTNIRPLKFEGGQECHVGRALCRVGGGERGEHPHPQELLQERGDLLGHVRGRVAGDEQEAN